MTTVEACTTDRRSGEGYGRSDPAADHVRDLAEPVDDGVGCPLAVTYLFRRDRAVWHVDGTHPGVRGAPDVVEEAVSDVDAPSRVAGPDRLQRGVERVR